MNKNLWAKKGQKYLLIGYPPCSTCKKAEKYLQSHELQYDYRNIKTESLNKKEIEEIWKKSGRELKKFFNTSGILYREQGLARRLPGLSEDEQLELLASDGMLVKRPILLYCPDGEIEAICVGFREKEWEALV